ncbi:DUF2946 domain-containing protein [Caballeronia sp. LZ062]|uniref:DUF2946 domain-containing protein n=1 Tax=unclassified Caballeronia TaxID=2646786 RepID=UPI00285F7563|nr:MULTISPECIES: DUF2946 domain-containing protein [unclassified Caballeronia]MDR5854483.1 DUF2946 domain-containing protein [Caballeronia sp. LZ050]MDR5870987.1 DUF2946 domain-containing protein [Caballeronia sp. LZ062]
MTRNARNRFVAWLGIAAMWLAIVAPVISQSIAARNEALDPEAALCTVDTLAGLLAQSGEHASHHTSHADADEQASHHDGAGHFDACSYCGLLAHHLPVASAASQAVTRIERVTRAAPIAVVDAACSKSYNAASARAPPVDS